MVLCPGSDYTIVHVESRVDSIDEDSGVIDYGSLHDDYVTSDASNTL
jgi:hypothetical protein